MASKSAERSIKSYFTTKAAGDKTRTPTNLRPAVNSPRQSADNGNETSKRRLPEEICRETMQGQRKMARSLNAAAAAAEAQKAEDKQPPPLANAVAFPTLDFTQHVRKLFEVDL